MIYRGKAYMNSSLSIIRFLGMKLAIYLAAVLVTYLLASITATQSVISNLAGMGVDVNIADRLSMTFQDILGMAGMYLPMVAFALLIAFLVTALICRWLSQWRMPLYILAGAVAIVAIHLALNLAFNLTPIAIARSPGGLMLQALAGAAGAYVYVFLQNKIKKPQSGE